MPGTKIIINNIFSNFCFPKNVNIASIVEDIIKKITYY